MIFLEIFFLGKPVIFLLRSVYKERFLLVPFVPLHIVEARLIAKAHQIKPFPYIPFTVDMLGLQVEKHVDHAL
jgi:hypothetical protein